MIRIYVCARKWSSVHACRSISVRGLGDQWRGSGGGGGGGESRARLPGAWVEDAEGAVEDDGVEG